MHMRFALFATAALFAATSASAAVVVNGDFEAGNTGFTSSYTYQAPFTAPDLAEAKYSVALSAANTHSLFANYNDHTSGSGQYMVVNGSGTANTIVYASSPISVTSGLYNFSAWLSTAYPGNEAVLQFTVTPDVGAVVSLGNFNAPTTVGVWQQVGASFVVAPGTTSITLSIVNQNIALGGNDFGIDDITLTSVPEPATWGLMLAGFAMTGFAARRRRIGSVAA